MSSAAWMPATPPPITSARRVTGTRSAPGVVVTAPWPPPCRIRSMALAVACVAVVVHPGAMLADVGHFDQVGVQARVARACGRSSGACAASTRPPPRRQPLFGHDLLADHRLPRVRAHVLVMLRATHAGQLGFLHHFSTSTVRAMFSPHQHTKTPIRDISSCLHHEVPIDPHSRASGRAPCRPRPTGSKSAVELRRAKRFDRRLLHVQVHVAHGAGHHQAVGAVRRGVPRIRPESSSTVSARHGHAGAAALGLVIPFDRASRPSRRRSPPSIAAARRRRIPPPVGGRTSRQP
jgi:hypothetical protein